MTSDVHGPQLPIIALNDHCIPTPQASPKIHIPGSERVSQPTNQDDNRLQDALRQANQVVTNIAESSELEDPKLSNHFAAGQNLANALAAGPELKGIEASVRGFAESSRVLMNVLDEISKLHPFIGVAVLAFKAVIVLELKRRDNDQKVIALTVQMKDMMSTLLQLRFIKDSSLDGITLEGRMRTLMEKVADNIKACGNACDAYMKKNIVVKVLKGPIWEGRLADFSVVFVDRRNEIEHVLALHTALGVNSANNAIAAVHSDVRTMNEKLNTLQLFGRLDSPFEKELKKIIEEKKRAQGSIDDDVTLRELAMVAATKDTSFLTTTRTSGKPVRSGSMADPFQLSSLRHELNRDIDNNLASNMVKYERKLEVQKRQLVMEIEDLVQREGDRVISAVVSGPHDRVLDTDLHTIWKEMGWKGSVKARHFVLALHDYFNEKYRDTDLAEIESFVASPCSIPSTISEQPSDVGAALTTALGNSHLTRRGNDQWALAYINILRVQSLLEAFDDDSTGFVTVKEANEFTSSRPKDWSLPHWMAFWAAGWHSTVWHYRGKIKRILTTMWNSLEQVLPFNRRIVDMYLGSEPFCRIELLLRSINPYHSENDGDLREKIRPYVAQEEARIKNNLVSVAFDIDAPNTLSLITGPGRIERYIFPLLYLVLRRHLQIIQIASRKILSDAELHRANDLRFIFNAIDERITNLTAIFKQKSLDVTAQLNSFAFGMFKLLNDPELADDLDKEKGNDSGYEDYEEDGQDTDDLNILKYGSQGEEYERAAYDASASETTTPELEVALYGPPSMEGIWTGLNLYDGQSSTDGLTQIVIHVTSDGGSFCGRGTDGLGAFTISGHTQRNVADHLKVKFTKVFTDLQYGTKTIWIYKGKLDPSSRIISGRWSVEAPRKHVGDFYLGLSPAFTYQFKCSPAQFAENPARARWLFACRAIRHQVRQRMWSWSYFKHRRLHRNRFLELFKRRELTRVWYLPADTLTVEENAELLVLERSLPPPDGLFYHSLGLAENRSLCIHFNASCDVCSATIVGSRVMCLECVSKRDEISLCTTCVGYATTRRNFVHEPTHGIVRVQHVVHGQEKPSLRHLAKERVNKAKAIFSGSERGSHRGQLYKDDGTALPKSVSSESHCKCCDDVISIPCWACVYCGDNVFICDDCVLKRASCSYEYHSDKHPLVRCDWPNVISIEVKTFEARLVKLEARVEDDQRILNLRLDRLEKRLDDHEGFMTKKLVSLESTMEGRLNRMEDLLVRMATKFGA